MTWILLVLSMPLYIRSATTKITSTTMKTISTTYPADSITPLSVGATSIKI